MKCNQPSHNLGAIAIALLEKASIWWREKLKKRKMEGVVRWMDMKKSRHMSTKG